MWERDAITNMLVKHKAMVGKNSTSEDSSLIGDMTRPDLSDLLTATINDLDDGIASKSKTAMVSSSRFAEIQTSDSEEESPTNLTQKRTDRIER